MINAQVSLAYDTSKVVQQCHGQSQLTMAESCCPLNPLAYVLTGG